MRTSDLVHRGRKWEKLFAADNMPLYSSQIDSRIGLWGTGRTGQTDGSTGDIFHLHDEEHDIEQCHSRSAGRIHWASQEWSNLVILQHALQKSATPSNCSSDYFFLLSEESCFGGILQLMTFNCYSEVLMSHFSFLSLKLKSFQHFVRKSLCCAT